MVLDAASEEDLEEVLLEGWAAQAPKRLSRPYLEGRGLAGEGRPTGLRRGRSGPLAGMSGPGAELRWA